MLARRLSPASENDLTLMGLFSLKTVCRISAGPTHALIARGGCVEMEHVGRERAEAACSVRRFKTEENAPVEAELLALGVGAELRGKKTIRSFWTQSDRLVVM